jgi:hypothetical protein
MCVLIVSSFLICQALRQAGSEEYIWYWTERTYNLHEAISGVTVKKQGQFSYLLVII